jgi:hypothetical protein
MRDLGGKLDMMGRIDLSQSDPVLMSGNKVLSKKNNAPVAIYPGSSNNTTGSYITKMKWYSVSTM